MSSVQAKNITEREREGPIVEESFQTDVWYLPFGSSSLLVMTPGFQAKFHVILSATIIQHNAA